MILRLSTVSGLAIVSINTDCTTMPKEMSKASASAPSAEVPSIPDGLVLAIGPNGERCLVAEYLVPATEQALAMRHKRTELGIRDEAGGVSHIFLFSTARCKPWY